VPVNSLLEIDGLMGREGETRLKLGRKRQKSPMALKFLKEPGATSQVVVCCNTYNVFRSVSLLSA
jgi:hypothetical protein